MTDRAVWHWYIWIPVFLITHPNPRRGYYPWEWSWVPNRSGGDD